MNIQSQARIAEDERLRREAEIRLKQERQQEEQRRQQEEMRRRNEEIRRSQAGQAQQVGLGGGGMGGAPNPAMISKFTGGGGGGGAGGAAGGGSGASGGLAAAGPWAALAAAVIGNEAAAKDAGRRPDSKSKWGTELLTGKVLERDMDYYGDKVGGIGGQALKGIGQLGNPEGTLKFIKKLF